MAVKSFLSVDEAVHKHLNTAPRSISAADTSARGKKPRRSGSEILSDLYTRMDDLLDEITASDETVTRKAEAYGKVARILKSLVDSERIAQVTIENKALEDMDSAEIEQLAHEALIARKSAQNKCDFPNQNGSRRVTTTSLTKQNKNDSPKKELSKQQKRALQGAEQRRRKAQGLPAKVNGQHHPDFSDATDESVDDILDELGEMLS